MKSLRYHVLATAAALIAACAMTTAPVAFAAATTAAAHDHGHAMPSKLTLDQGRKWGTDASLRTGMESIRTLVEPKLGAAHEGKLNPAEYAALASQVETEIGGIVANCKLEPKADAMLHRVVADILAGTDAMAGKAPKIKPQQGLVQVATAVNNYARYFDHPAFTPIHVGH